MFDFRCDDYILFSFVESSCDILYWRPQDELPVEALQTALPTLLHAGQRQQHRPRQA